MANPINQSGMAISKYRMVKLATKRKRHVCSGFLMVIRSIMRFYILTTGSRTSKREIAAYIKSLVSDILISPKLLSAAVG